MANLSGPTGSLMNNIAANSRQETPAVGMGATRLGWSDRHAYTIVEVVNAKTIRVQRDRATRIDKNGMSESQRYEFARDPEGSTDVVVLRKNGRWVTKGESMRSGTAWLIGHREEYFDFSF